MKKIDWNNLLSFLIAAIARVSITALAVYLVMSDHEIFGVVVFVSSLLIQGKWNFEEKSNDK